ncbi:hypothetical protein CAP36_14700 [Chitinophagaceae bacterium IBVUCB2]|nr:hypothetical protein CAP36_14700 [Chitinophagaceae bacterium IBVUCB2]
MKRIVVPTDFSPNADKALNTAVQIAKKAKATLIVVHACDLLELTFKDNLALKKEYNRGVIMEAKGKLALLKKSIESVESVKVQIKLYEGDISNTIIHAAKVNKADLIIMGTLGNAGIQEKIMGSKTAAAIGNTTIPILAVPLLSNWTPPAKFLLAINNFAEGNNLAVNPVFELAELFNAEIHITKFTKEGTAKATDYLAAERVGNAYAKKLQSLHKNIQVSFIHLDGNKFEKTIEKYIAKNNIDIVAMLTHKRTFLKSIFNRSMTKKMSYHTSIPLLALPL